MNVEKLIDAKVVKVYGGKVDKFGDVLASSVQLQLADGSVVLVTPEHDTYGGLGTYLEIA